jgi:S1-C subfamily serine protease
MESAEIAWVEPPAPPPGQAQAGGFRTRFGSQPDYSYPGPGLRLAGTSPNSPAERAGLLPGDVVMTLDEVRVDSVYDLMYALNAHKPGDVVPVRFERDGAEQEVRVTLASPYLE